MNGEEIHAALRTVIQLCEAQEIRYALMGALALSFYDQARATHDVDVLIEPAGENFQRIRAVLQEYSLVEDETWLLYNSGIRDSNMRLILRRVPIDLMLPRDAQDQSALERRRAHAVGNEPIWVIAPEDIVLQKLKTGRPRDLDDAIPFFVRHRDQLEHEYLNSWARRLGVREELDYLWSQSEPPADS